MAETPHQRHPGFRRVFAPGRMTLGFMMPLTQLDNGVPNMTGQLELAERVDALGFAALWARDVPFFDPSFGDAGQVYDPWVWLGMLAARTRRISLGTAGIVLPLRHPFHTAKAAQTLDAVTGGRFLLGGASGDRPAEFPAFAKHPETRGQDYRDAIRAIREVAADFPQISGPFGEAKGLDMLPKPGFGTLPLLAIGSAQQSVQWLAENMDGWMTYPRDLPDQRNRIGLWHSALEQRAPGIFKPFGQPLFIDLSDQPDEPPSPIFLGFRLGRNYLLHHLESLAALGVNHVALQMLFNKRPVGETVEEIAAEVLPHFPSLTLKDSRGVTAAQNHGQSEPQEGESEASLHARLDAMLDEALMATFPASDPIALSPSFPSATKRPG